VKGGALLFLLLLLMSRKSEKKRKKKEMKGSWLFSVRLRWLDSFIGTSTNLKAPSNYAKHTG